MKWTRLNFTDKAVIESIITKSLNYSEVWIDFFCGFGGVTMGIERTKLTADGIATVIACLNHDENAIGSHKLSHPDCYHITEDIRLAYTDVLKYMVREIRRKSNGTIKVKLWFSHECTHYSIAKGGDSRDADSRSLPEELHRYIDDLNPDAVWIENVREFLTWGPLEQKRDADGHLMYKDGEPWMVPIVSQKGIYFTEWRDAIIAKGFKYDYQFLNCADYGCPTIRKRVFIQFLKNEEIVWAKPTHAKNGAGGLKTWIAIRTCLDLNDKGPSIFQIKPSGKPRIASRKTFKRLYDGCKRILEPMFEKAVKEAQFVSMSFGNGINMSAGSPSPIVATKNVPQIVTPNFMSSYHGSNCSTERNRIIDDPSAAITTNDMSRVVTPQFISNQYGNTEGQAQSIDDPAGTIPTVPKGRVISTQFIDKQYGQSNPGPIEDPANTIPGKPKLALVSAEPFIMSTNYDNPPKPIEEPSQVLTASRKRHYLINMQFNNTGHSIEDPSITLVAKMDKKPNYLITTEEGLAIEIFDTDFPEVVLLKQFMAKWGIGDILMRELRIPEMLKIHTMPPDLPMVGTITDRKKFIGNQVPAQIVTELILGSYYGNNRKEQAA